MRPDTPSGSLLKVERLNQESILIEIMRPSIWQLRGSPGTRDLNNRAKKGTSREEVIMEFSYYESFLLFRYKEVIVDFSYELYLLFRFEEVIVDFSYESYLAFRHSFLKKLIVIYMDFEVMHEQP